MKISRINVIGILALTTAGCAGFAPNAMAVAAQNISPVVEEEEFSVPPDAVIPSDDQLVLRRYLRSNFKPRCPTAIYKKTNNCLPMGIARRYNIGQPLPGSVNFAELPESVQKQLHPAHGYRYVRVDKDVLLMLETTKRVVDTVTLKSALE